MSDIKQNIVLKEVEPLLTLDQAARLAPGCPVHQRTIQNWISAGILPATRINRRLYIRASDLKKVAKPHPGPAAKRASK